MTSAARGRAVGVIAVLLVAAATMAGSATVPVRTGGTGTTHHDHSAHAAHDHGAHAARRGRAGCRGRGRADQRAAGAGRAHGPRARAERRGRPPHVAQGFRRARPGSICEGGYELISKQGTRCTHGDDVELAERAATARRLHHR